MGHEFEWGYVVGPVTVMVGEVPPLVPEVGWVALFGLMTLATSWSVSAVVRRRGRATA